MDPKILARLESADNLPVIPALAAQVLSVIENSQSKLTDICDIISLDPSLSLSILKTANSAFYGQQREVSSVRSALVLIGLNRVIPMVLALSFKTSVDDLKSAASSHRLDMDSFWRRAVLMSCLSAKLAEYTGGVKQEEAMLAGLLQDIGVLACMSAFPSEYSPLLDERLFTDHDQLQALERNTFGSEHSEIGAWLLNRWNFPQAIVASVLNSHNIPSKKENTLQWCVAGANCIANDLLSKRNDGDLLTRLGSALDSDWLSMTENQIDQAATEILELLSVTEALFEIGHTNQSS